MKTFILAILVAATAAVSTLPSAAADPKPAGEPKTAPARSLPFHGKIDSVDKQARTVTVGDRVFHITSTTRIIKEGKPATLDDAKVGEDVAGAYRQSAEKQMNLVSLRLGAKPPAAPKKKEQAK